VGQAIVFCGLPAHGQRRRPLAPTVVSHHGENEMREKPMKRLTVCIAVALACLGLHVAIAQSVLTNESILKMVSDKQGDDLILLMIQNQPCDFSMTADDLKKLKDQGVSDKVLAAMITKQTAKADEKPLGKGTGPIPKMRPSVISTGSTSTDPNDPVSPHKQGIWLYVENKMTPLPSAAMKEMKNSSMVPSLVNPFHKIKQKTAFIGPRSDLRTPANPTFYFYGYEDMRYWSLAKFTRVRISCLTAFRTLKTLGIARLSA
jgi:hypothetical protein